jgi:hypothetical protein
MSRESRIVAILLGFGVAGLGALWFAADRYQHLAPSTPAPPVAAARGLRPDLPAAGGEAASVSRPLDAFVAARLAGRAICERFGVSPEDRSWSTEVLAAYRIARLSALAEHEVTDARYAEIRAAWRDWSAGKPVSDRALASRLDARRAELLRDDLGRFEALDQAIE